MFPGTDQQQQPQAQYPPQGYPPQGGYPQQGAPYAPPPGYPPPQQGYYPPAAPQQPPTANAGLDDFFNAPSTGGGPAIKFKDKPIGTRYAGIVARKITNADVRQQTDPSGRPLTYRDGRPKFVMVVPLIVQQTPEFNEGRATWWVKGAARDELVRAMSEAGAPEGPPEEGAGIVVELTGHRPIPGLNPQYLYKVTYTRPQGGAFAAKQAAAAAPEQAQQATPEQAQQAPAQPVAQAPAQQAPAVQVPPDMTDEQAALLAKLTGNVS